MRTRARLTDVCLWLAHIEDGPLKRALASLAPGAIISLQVDDAIVNFQRMATGKDGRLTQGFNPVGTAAAYWRDRYAAGDHQEIELDFAGCVHD